jgi:hypothetical protein
MSKAQRIDDHNSPVGKRGKEYPLPMESKMVSQRSAEGAGKMGEYDQTNDDIVRDQSAGDSKIKGRPMKTGFRY